MSVATILEKELRELTRNRLLLLTVVLPVGIFALMPVVMLYAARFDPMTPNELELLYRLEPTLRALDPVTATQVLLISQTMLLFLIVPATVPLVIASFSIIGEKQARSLEPLLATPISVRDLLLGKCLGAVLPALGATWLGYAVGLAGIALVGTPLALQAALNPVWVVSMFTLAPLLCLAAVALALIVSSRVNDTRVAQQFSIVLILPLIGLFAGQFAGQVLVEVRLVLLASLAILVVDLALFWVAVRLFRRETILTEWR
ncbi:MAG: ABC transporter permease subunit [Chloroflexota bacterium]